MLSPSLLATSDLETGKGVLTDYELIVDSYEDLQIIKNKGNTIRSKKQPIKWQRYCRGSDRETRTYQGQIFDERQSAFAPQQKFPGDKGYQGGKPMTKPQPEPRNKELSPEDKLRNKALAGQGTVVEHLICLSKIFDFKWHKQDLD